MYAETICRLQFNQPSAASAARGVSIRVFYNIILNVYLYNNKSLCT